MSTQGEMDTGHDAALSPREYDEMTINGVFDYVRTLVGLPAQVQALTAAMTAANETIRSLAQQVNELREELANARDTIREKNDAIATLEAKTEEQGKEINQVRQELFTVRTERDNAEHTVSTLRGVLIERDNVVNRLQHDLADASQIIDEHKLHLATREQDISYWKTRHDNQEELVNQHSVTIATRDAEIARLVDALTSATARERQLESALGDILHKVNSLLGSPSTVTTGDEWLAKQPADGQVDPQPDTAPVGFVEWPLVAISA